MEELVRSIVTALVDTPDKVTVTSTQKPEGTLLTVSVDPRDAGLIIGKRGYVIRSIRQLASVIANRLNSRVFVDIVPLE